MLKQLLIILMFLSSVSYALTPEQSNKLLGRGMNLGNALEAPNEGDWGVTLKEEYFSLIASKGFNSVRIPIRWYNHADSLSPYTVDSTFFARIDWAIDNALAKGLAVLIDMHHYETLYETPADYKDQFLGIWEQISKRYKNYSDSLMFEILNEPHSNLGVDLWNQYLKEALEIIRMDNPTKTVIIGPADWGGISALNELVIPEGEDNAILSIHYYLPFEFTHQGASWVEGADAWLGTTWDGSGPEKQAMVDDMAFIRNYAEKNNMQVYVGEFGAYSKADMESRALWTEYCGRLFEKWNFSWAYWEFCSGYGIYDDAAKTFYDDLVNALISDDTTCLFIDTTVNIGPNILQNGDFSDNMNHWTYGAWQGEATGAVENGIMKSHVITTGANSWNIQLLQDNLSIESGKEYYLAFNALSSDNLQISAAIMRSDNYSSYASTPTYLLSDADKKYSIKFTASESFSNVRVVFNLGFDTGIINIDNVFFAEWEPTDISKSSSEVRYALWNFDRGSIFLNNDFNEPFQVELFNLQGQKLFSKTYVENIIKISLKKEKVNFSGPIVIRIKGRNGYSFKQLLINK